MMEKVAHRVLEAKKNVNKVIEKDIFLNHPNRGDYIV